MTALVIVVPLMLFQLATWKSESVIAYVGMLHD